MKNTMEKIAIIIPTFNRKNYLHTILTQLRNQKTLDFVISIIVVVDGSTDGTLEMLKIEFPYVHIVKGDGQWWWTKSINAGCLLALKKEVKAILLMNDDIEIENLYIQNLLNAYQQEPNSIIGSLNVTIEKPNKVYFSGVKQIIWWKAKSIRYHKRFEPYQKTMTGLHKSVLLMGRGMLIPVSVFKKIGLLNQVSFPQYKSDLDFVLTANKNNINTLISWDAIIYSHMEKTGKGVTYIKQGIVTFLKSFFQKNSMTNLVHSFRYYKKHCPFYLLPFSFIIDKLRLLYSFLHKRNKIQ